MKNYHLLQLLSAVAIPVFYLIFVTADHTGLLDKFLGLDLVEDVSERFEISYAEDASRPVRPDEPAWRPLLSLIERYTTVDLPQDKEPKVFARQVAVISAKTDLPGGGYAEWTAPTTPVLLIYREWPGQTVPREDVRIVGTIGDIRLWVEQRRAELRFLFQDIFLGLLAVTLASVIWFGDFRKEKKGKGSSSPEK
jgi:hypothetical protein